MSTPKREAMKPMMVRMPKSQREFIKFTSKRLGMSDSQLVRSVMENFRQRCASKNPSHKITLSVPNKGGN